ncbi:MAG TPA: hypothetical protein VFT09_04910, partial [Ilumatobacteraceae bacterium]|nr:hypothetical protein [Ilumatobacteraceae bacterium]
MDHEPLPTRTTSPALRWVVALLLAVVGSAGLVPSTEVDEVARVHQAVLADDHRVARRRARPRPRPVAHRRPRVVAAVA